MDTNLLSTMLLHTTIVLFCLGAVHSQVHQECPHATGLNPSEIEATSRKFLQVLKKFRNSPAEIVFVLDSSDSVGPVNFSCEVQLVRDVSKLFTVSADDSRVAVVTYAGCYQIYLDVNYIEYPQGTNKCTLLRSDLQAARYREGFTCAVGHGGLLGAQLALEESRAVPKLVFVFTNNQATGGQAVKLVASSLKENGATIFVIAVGSGVRQDQITSASTPIEDHVFPLHLLSDVATLAIEDEGGLTLWDRNVNSSLCDSVCSQGHDCCDSRAICACATQTGSYGCACHPGYTAGGPGGECEACPTAAYKPEYGNHECTECPDSSTTAGEGKVGLDACECLPRHEGDPKAGIRCARAFRCDRLSFNASSGVLVFPTDCDNRNGTECRLQCRENYRAQLGTAERVECLITEQWSATPLKCIPKNCPILLVGEYMRIIPPDCGQNSSEYDAQCFYDCNCGFQLTGVSSRICQTDGTWTDPSVESTCIDIEPPVFITCPGDLSLPTDLHQNFATNPASWDQPEARDNSGVPIVEASSSAMQETFSLDQVTMITYTARDKAGLESVCTFSVTVTDMEAPQITRCPASFEVETGDSLLAVVYWEEPVFEDNSGNDVSVFSNRRSGSTFYLGQPERVWYIAQDQAGNIQTCDFTVSAVEVPIAPEISCPASITKVAEPSLSSAEVTWDMPTISDNVDNYGALIVTVRPSGLESPHRFEIGFVVITYTATDAAGLSTQCSFKVVVLDTQPPVVENCPEDTIHITSPQRIKAVSWEEPQFADNSKEDLNFTQSHEPGVDLTWGSHIVKYSATDAAGLTTECQFIIRIGPTSCPHHPDPRNGARACDQWLFGTFCRVYCNQDFEFAEKPAPWYICGQGRWTTNSSGYSIPWPDCSERHQADGGTRLGIETQYYAGSSTNPKTQRTIQSAFVDDFRRSMFGRSGGCVATNSCQADEVTVYNGEIDEDV